MTAREYLTKQVQEHEAYIRSPGVSIARGEYGDYDHAEWELMASAENAGLLNDWEFDYEQEWFVKLAWRQARCNFYQHCD